MITDYVRVAAVGDLDEGTMMQVDAEGEPILLAYVHGEYFAIHNICSHTWAMLDQGTLYEYEVQCPLHVGRFDIRTGEPTQKPAIKPVCSYSVMVQGDGIYVKSKNKE